MNPAAPRDPVLTRVLLSIAGALFLLNLCVLVAGIHARPSQPVAIVEPPDVHRCVPGHVVVTGVAVDELSLDLEALRGHIEGVRWRMEEISPRLHVVVQTPALPESL